MATTIPLTPVSQHPPVDEFWTCKRSGDCCTTPAEVVMTVEEQQRISRKIALDPKLDHIKTEWRYLDGEDKKFVALKAHPCPFFIFKSCVVYDVRPYNCRRFACMRPDPTTEPFVVMGPEYGEMEGQVANVVVRLVSSKAAQRLYARIQRSAQKWARQNGWNIQ